MEYVTLAPGLPSSSRLGFGCGSVMGRVGRGQSMRAIAAALDRGITHFDVARLYGYGDAEAVLGEALRGSRDDVVVASKFGLVPTRAASLLRGLRPLAQRAITLAPMLRAPIRAVVGAAQSGGELSAAAIEASLNASLRALQTDYLDILFMHEGSANWLSDEVRECLDRQIAAGKIRAYGAAGGIEAVTGAAGRQNADIVCQFANSACFRNVERLPVLPRAVVGHSPFLGADTLAARLRSNTGLVRLSPQRPLEATDIPELMLQYALSARGVGVVLCSMLQDSHLDKNIRIAEEPRFSPDELASFLDFIRQGEAHR